MRRAAYKISRPQNPEIHFSQRPEGYGALPGQRGTHRDHTEGWEGLLMKELPGAPKLDAQSMCRSICLSRPSV